MKVTILIEGAANGPDSKLLQVQCREAFHKLFAKCGLSRSPKLKACGGRGQAYKMFLVAHSHAARDTHVALLVDSEEPVSDVERTWDHLKLRDKWKQPAGATDEQVLLMTTCMETWIVVDRQTLRKHYGSRLRENALPPLHQMEMRNRHAIQDALANATADCQNSYEKGKRSFDVLGKLQPDELLALKTDLPSFARCVRILKAKM